jgi:hypothetical protein
VRLCETRGRAAWSVRATSTSSIVRMRNRQARISGGSLANAHARLRVSNAPADSFCTTVANLARLSSHLTFLHAIAPSSCQQHLSLDAVDLVRAIAAVNHSILATLNQLAPSGLVLIDLARQGCLLCALVSQVLPSFALSFGNHIDTKAVRQWRKRKGGRSETDPESAATGRTEPDPLTKAAAIARCIFILRKALLLTSSHHHLHTAPPLK